MERHQVWTIFRPKSWKQIMVALQTAWLTCCRCVGDRGGTYGRLNWQVKLWSSPRKWISVTASIGEESSFCSFQTKSLQCWLWSGLGWLRKLWTQNWERTRQDSGQADHSRIFTEESLAIEWQSPLYSVCHFCWLHKKRSTWWTEQ